MAGQASRARDGRCHVSVIDLLVDNRKPFCDISDASRVGARSTTKGTDYETRNPILAIPIREPAGAVMTIYREPVGAACWSYWTQVDGKRTPLSGNRAMTMVAHGQAELVTVGQQIAVTPQVRP